MFLIYPLSLLFADSLVVPSTIEDPSQAPRASGVYKPSSDAKDALNPYSDPYFKKCDAACLSHHVLNRTTFERYYNNQKISFIEEQLQAPGADKQAIRDKYFLQFCKEDEDVDTCFQRVKYMHQLYLLKVRKVETKEQMRLANIFCAKFDAVTGQCLVLRNSVKMPTQDPASENSKKQQRYYFSTANELKAWNQDNQKLNKVAAGNGDFASALDVLKPTESDFTKQKHVTLSEFEQNNLPMHLFVYDESSQTDQAAFQRAKDIYGQLKQSSDGLKNIGAKSQKTNLAISDYYSQLRDSIVTSLNQSKGQNLQNPTPSKSSAVVSGSKKFLDDPKKYYSLQASPWAQNQKAQEDLQKVSGIDTVGTLELW